MYASKKLDSVMAACFEQEARNTCADQKLSGVVCMAASSSELLYSNTFGVADISTNAPLTADSVYFIASMTKPIVASACMQLVEQGLLDLDTDVGEYVADFKNPLVLDGFDQSGVPMLRPAKSKVTLRSLMAQTSGITHEGWDPRRKEWCSRFGIGGLGKEARRVPLCYDPGEKWFYGLGMDWVMECICAVTGQTLEEYLQEHIFRPLGMNSTSFHLKPHMAPRKVALHLKTAGSRVTSNTVENQFTAGYGDYYDYGEGEGHGGLYSTANDYLRFLRMILNKGTLDGVRILSPESVELMRTPQTGELYMHWEPALRANAYGVDMDYLVAPGTRAKWGLGWMVNPEESPLGRAPGGMSWFGGFDTYMWADPGSDLCAVVMCQTKMAASEEILQIVWDFEKMLHHKLAA